MKVGVCVNMAGGYWGEGVCECVCVLLYKTYILPYLYTYSMCIHMFIGVCPCVKKNTVHHSPAYQ